ncbi:hypothetical protein [Phytohabitans houttuyneae]|uniref:hypothetical protein n=1 Tax=Phytohabitans houttuyneae TaxID=1076126 RepID=UPI00156716F5|nr:hypothetical protein [Phytohabitans houttuyneae]
MRVLRQPPGGAGRSYGGFTRAGDRVVWAESAAGRDGTPASELWEAGLGGGAPRRITADTGWLTLGNSEHAMVVEAGRLYWTALAPGAERVTEVRSVPLDGGPVRVSTLPGTWALAGWPWLVGTGGGPRGPTQLHDLATGATATVDLGDGDEDVDRCGPAWCRLFVLSGDAPVRTVLVRPDGSDRRTATSSGATAAIEDVAVLDRFEVLAGDSSALATAVGGRRLLVYDLRTRRLVAVADAASRVAYRDGVLWWSTSGGGTTWHTLDLRTV